MTKRKIGIVGCGPAGLLAAHSAVTHGHDVDIFAPEQLKSPHASATFLHRSIPGITGHEPDGEIKYLKKGQGTIYASKVYGDPTRVTSWDRIHVGSQEAWALAPAYDALWDLYSGLISEMRIGATSLQEMSRSFDRVYNSAPAREMCYDEHNFAYREIKVLDGYPDQTHYEPNMMIYSGAPSDKWYRASDIFGTRTTEFAYDGWGFSNGIKVVGNDCTCHMNIKRIGRWGTWTPGVLMHHAFEAVEDEMQRLF